jgi:hypothetical protein
MKFNEPHLPVPSAPSRAWERPMRKTILVNVVPLHHQRKYNEYGVAKKT